MKHSVQHSDGGDAISGGLPFLPAPDARSRNTIGLHVDVWSESLAAMTPLGEFCSYFSALPFNGFSQGPIKGRRFCCCRHRSPPPPKLPYGEDNARLCVKSHNIGIVCAHAIHTSHCPWTAPFKIFASPLFLERNNAENITNWFCVQSPS